MKIKIIIMIITDKILAHYGNLRQLKLHISVQQYQGQMVLFPFFSGKNYISTPNRCEPLCLSGFTGDVVLVQVCCSLKKLHNVVMQRRCSLFLKLHRCNLLIKRQLHPLGVEMQFSSGKSLDFLCFCRQKHPNRLYTSSK